MKHATPAAATRTKPPLHRVRSTTITDDAYAGADPVMNALSVLTLSFFARLTSRTAWLAWLLPTLALAATEAPTSEPDLQAGPFTLQTVRQRGSLQFNANYGFIRPTYFERRVLLGGRPLALTTAPGERTTFFRHAWVLPSAAQPTLLLGDRQGWWLLTDKAGQPQLDGLLRDEDTGIEWVESAEPATDNASQVRSSEGEPMRLEGGRFLVINRKLLLDTQTLRRVNLPQTVPAGYTPVSTGLLALSPDGRALARWYRGESLSWRDALITVTDLATGRVSQQSVDLQALTGLADSVPRHSVLPLMVWQAQGSGTPTLQWQAAANGHPPWQADFQLGLRAPRGPQDEAVPRFVIGPVRPSMLRAAQSELEEMGYVAQPPAAGGVATADVVHLGESFVPLRLQLDRANRTLLIQAERAPGVLWAQQAVVQAGERLLSRLQAGGLREHLIGSRP